MWNYAALIIENIWKRVETVELFHSFVRYVCRIYQSVTLQFDQVLFSSLLNKNVSGKEGENWIEHRHSIIHQKM